MSPPPFFFLLATRSAHAQRRRTLRHWGTHDQEERVREALRQAAAARFLQSSTSTLAWDTVFNAWLTLLSHFPWMILFDSGAYRLHWGTCFYQILEVTGSGEPELAAAITRLYSRLATLASDLASCTRAEHCSVVGLGGRIAYSVVWWIRESPGFNQNNVDQLTTCGCRFGRRHRGSGTCM